MADFIIKSAAGTGNNTLIQGADASPAITIAETGTTTFAENVTMSGTANALGTVTSGNLSHADIVMPRFKEVDKFWYDAVVNTNTENLDALNISGSHYVTVTPEHTNDYIEFGYDFNVWSSGGYMGWGIQSSTATDFSANLNILWRVGRHAHKEDASDQYSHIGGYIMDTASEWGLSADTTYYCRMIGMTHSTDFSYDWGANGTNIVKGGKGIRLAMKRWSIV